MKAIEEMIKKLEKRHLQHIEVYGSEFVSSLSLSAPAPSRSPFLARTYSNDLRLTGRHETGHIGQFSYGVANRGSSIRIPKSVAVAGKGYFEDRRPASNIGACLLLLSPVEWGGLCLFPLPRLDWS